MPNPDDIDATLRVLAELVARPELCDAAPSLARVREQAAALARGAKRSARQEARQRDRDLLDRTLLRAGAGDAPPAASLARPRPCYVCGRAFAEVHAFYDSLCGDCAARNWGRRSQTCDLSGRVALVTGGRVKIGHHVALRLLRAGAAVHVTTRFPHDAARRFTAEADCAAWSGRLRVHGLDLRALAEVERFADSLCESEHRLDIVVNNAAQTVRRPAAYYRTLIEGETGESSLIAPGSRRAAELAALPILPEDRATDLALFPAGEVDVYGRPADLRAETSWTKELPAVELGELLEVHAINCLAPFVLLRRLDPLLMRDTTGPRFVVNVASAEGSFAAGKNGRHPHTNMSKAALNMITRTCAESYAERGVYINSVDPGWVSNEAPAPHAARMERDGFREPLDLTDAAARVLDPVFAAVRTGRCESGRLFKDYQIAPW
jgi:NAD(P)-dependent dehydrogenase (short-subunit alcohol dehydrogenase family)